jgi:excinuclease ABC subunit A
MEYIKIRGAREHNLKNVDLDIPKFKFITFTGVSGSGKTSLAMDTLFAEGQRRYVESLSSYARQFLGVLKKPDVDLVEGLSPSIAIDQKTVSHNPRSTVGTTTEIYDYLRLLFARIGHPHCENCGREISAMGIDQIVDSIISSNSRILLLSPVIKGRKGEHTKIFEGLLARGINYARIDGKIFKITTNLGLIKTNNHTIDAVIDRIVVPKKTSKEFLERIYSSVTTALQIGGGYCISSTIGDKSFNFPEFPEIFSDKLFSERLACPVCNISYPEIEPRVFSFNSPHGACEECQGLGLLLKIDENLILNEKLTVMEGGIFPWAKMLETDSYFKRMLGQVAKNSNFSLNSKIENLSKESIKVLLYGSDNVRDDGKYFEGAITNLERRYKETDSEYIRKEIEKYMYKSPCPKCLGTRLKQRSLSITITGFNIAEVSNFSLQDTCEWVNTIAIKNEISSKEKYIAEPIIKEIRGRLDFLIKVGLEYLTLSRGSETLAGGESQRIRLASQIGSGLSGVLYILDEPSIGLHPRDQERLINTLIKLRDLGNTVIVVEHDAQTMLASDWIVDFGPGAGVHGGHVLAKGTPDQIKSNLSSITGKYLSGKKSVTPIFTPDKEFPRKTLDIENSKKLISIHGCRENNLKNITVSFPMRKFICVTGMSGSGKSTLVVDTLQRQIREELGLKNNEKPGENSGILGVEHIEKIVSIDQSPIGRTPRSNPATYSGAFDYIRDLFALTKEAKIRGFDKGKFSFNVRGGRCDACDGDGQIKIEMQFMADVYVDCEVCGGKRYSREVLEVEYKNKNIHEVLNLTVEESLIFFENIPQIKRRFQTLYDVGLGYIKIGQSAPSLSGGEAQRIKLASELSKTQFGKTFYILDEPTTGLHFADLEKLIGVLKRLVYYGNTVCVIEHNLDLIKSCDYIIDLGPEGGDRGGEIIYSGPLDGILQNKKSHTGQQLAKFLKYS